MKRVLKILALCSLFGAVALGVFLYLHGGELLRSTVEKSLNESLYESFAGTVRLNRVTLSTDLKIQIDGFQGDLQTLHGSVPLAVTSLRSVDSLAHFLMNKPVRFEFEGGKPASSNLEGVRGEAVIQSGEQWSFRVHATIVSLDFRDLEWVNPEALKDASGTLFGDMYFKHDFLNQTDFELETEVREPGGDIQASFFDVLVPYLPQQSHREIIQKVSRQKGIVGFKRARFTAALSGPKTLKAFLNILVPEYNLNLNLNIEIRVDKENAFLELAQKLCSIEVAI